MRMYYYKPRFGLDYKPGSDLIVLIEVAGLLFKDLRYTLWPTLLKFQFIKDLNLSGFGLGLGLALSGLDYIFCPWQCCIFSPNDNTARDCSCTVRPPHIVGSVQWIDNGLWPCVEPDDHCSKQQERASMSSEVDDPLWDTATAWLAWWLASDQAPNGSTNDKNMYSCVIMYACLFVCDDFSSCCHPSGCNADLNVYRSQCGVLNALHFLLWPWPTQFVQSAALSGAIMKTHIFCATRHNG